MVPLLVWRSLSVSSLLFLLVAAGGPLTGAQGSDGGLLPGAANEQVVLVDAEGDVRSETSVGPGPQGPPSEWDAAVDVVSVALAETDESLLVSIHNRGYPTLTEMVGAYDNDYRCHFSFRVNDYERRSFNVYVERQPAEAGEWRLQGAFWTSGRDRGSPHDEVPLDAALVDADHIEVVLPKEYLSAGEHHRPMTIGDHLDSAAVRCEAFYPGVFLHDFADDGVPYLISSAPPLPRLALEFSLEPGSQPIARGAAERLPLAVNNLDDKPQRVLLTASLARPDGGAAPGWVVLHPTEIDVPAQSATTVSIFVTAPADAVQRSPAVVTVQATGADAATATTRHAVVSVVPTTVDENTLYFHNADADDAFCFPPCTPGAPSLQRYETRQFVMNAVEVDPEYTQAPAATGGGVIEVNMLHVAMDVPLVRPVALDGGLAEAALTLRSDLGRDVLVSVSVSERASFREIASGEAVVPVTPEYGTHIIPLTQKGQTLAAGSSFVLTAYVFEISPFVPPLRPIEWSPQDGHLRLSLHDAESLVPITDGRFLPRVIPDEDQRHYVRPGGTVAWALRLENQGTEADVVGLKATLEYDGWSAKVLPGSKFQLKPAHQAGVCVQVSAPKDVVHGTKTEVTLTGTSRGDAQASTAATYKLRVSRTMPIDNETCANLIDPDATGYVAPFKEAPGPPAAALLAALAVAAVAVRRNRGHPTADC